MALTRLSYGGVPCASDRDRSFPGPAIGFERHPSISVARRQNRPGGSVARRAAVPHIAGTFPDPEVSMPERSAPLALCYGTRPQVIKASLVIAALEDRYDLVTIDTGQHYDYELNALLYEQLGVRAPDVLLAVGSSDHARQTAAILEGAAAEFERRKPAAVIVIGDTNSTLGGALAAVKLRIPVVHVEAGLRARDRLMPEEINRRVVDAVADLLCAPSREAEARLSAESVGGRIVFTGDVARDVLERNLSRAPAPTDGDPFVLATVHRAELTADRDALAAVLDGLSAIDRPVLLPLHPRTRHAIEANDLTRRLGSNVRPVAPFGYLETLARIRDADLVITDSGGVQREAYWIGTPCATVRTETEWTATVALGANVLVDPRTAATALPEQVRRRGRTGPSTGAGWSRDAYGSGGAAGAIAAAVAAMIG
jgi:UDP-N-acetylglucosamine 2-epimerase